MTRRNDESDTKCFAVLGRLPCLCPAIPYAPLSAVLVQLTH